MDEITEMPMALQAKLLEVLQNKRFVRPGNGTPVEVDVRILAASTTSVESALAENKLREDLYHYLSAYTIQVPPLRQRREEIPVLVAPFHANILPSDMAYHLAPFPRVCWMRANRIPGLGTCES